jgi:nitrogen fixation-related uncharacterized protein
MPDVNTLKEELLKETTKYADYLISAIQHKKDYMPYSKDQVQELIRLVNKPDRITELHTGMTEHLKTKLNRPFGEAFRWAFSSSQYDHDLYNNLLRILTQPKYRADKLEHYEMLYDLDSHWEKRFKEQVEKCTNCHSAHAEKHKVEALNRELQLQINNITAELEKVKQERDQLRRECKLLTQQNSTLRAEKAQCQAALFKSEQENGKLKEQLRRTYCEQAEKEMPKPSFYSRCP